MNELLKEAIKIKIAPCRVNKAQITINSEVTRVMNENVRRLHTSSQSGI